MRTISFADLYGLTDAVKGGTKTMTRRKTKYKIGQELGVSERYSDIYERLFDEQGPLAATDYAIRVLSAHNKIIYNPDQQIRGLAGWRNKMYVKAELMPTHIVITDRKEQHIQNITDEECLLEGVKVRRSRLDGGNNYLVWGIDKHFLSPRGAFSFLINRLSKKIDGKPFWDANPKVYAYTFKVVDDER